MGNKTGKDGSDEQSEQGSAGSIQLFVTLHFDEAQALPGGLVPHVYGESPLVGEWDAAHAIPLERESATTWELSFVIPSDHEPLEFKFILKPKGVPHTFFAEEGAERLLVSGALSDHGSTSPTAAFRLGLAKSASGEDELAEFPVRVAARPVSPFTLAASFKSHVDHVTAHGTTVLGIPDVMLDEVVDSPETTKLMSTLALGDNLDSYVVEAPPNKPRTSYAADNTEDPRYLRARTLPPPSAPIPVGAQTGRLGVKAREYQRAATMPGDGSARDRCVSIKDLVVLDMAAEAVADQHRALDPPTAVTGIEGRPPLTLKIGTGGGADITSALSSPGSAGGAPPVGSGGTHRFIPDLDSDLPATPTSPGGPLSGLGVGSNEPRILPYVLSLGDLGAMSPQDSGMPDASGAVAAAAVADRMAVPRERRKLAIVLVGLPARGKTFTAAKLTRYLRWLGHETKHFNVGKYRRSKHGTNQTAEFFRPDNKEGVDARNEVAVMAMEDMLAWMDEGGQVGVYDATNSTRERRNMLMKICEGRCKVIFLESICTDPRIIDENIRKKVEKSPDYEDQPDEEVALEDFKTRLANYESVYESVNEGSYIKLVDMASGSGGQLVVQNISGYLPGRMVFFLLNTHITSRPILLTRHGESQDNVRGRIGGDPKISDLGEQYAVKLADFVHKRLKGERVGSVWTSTLQRTILTARHIHGFPKVQWRALDEINAGVCDGMTYQEIKESMPEEYQARKIDKLRYRYPRGESYLDVIQRLEPVIVELERQRAPVLVVAHQAVLRALYAYFMDKPLKEVPHIEMPLHMVVELTTGVSGIQEKRYKLME